MNNIMITKNNCLEKTDSNYEILFDDKIIISKNSILVREVAKIASNYGIVIGEKRLWNTLREWNLIFKNSTEPKQVGIEKGFFEVIEGYKTNMNKSFVYHTTKVTGKGQAYIISRLISEKY